MSSFSPSSVPDQPPSRLSNAQSVSDLKEPAKEQSTSDTYLHDPQLAILKREDSATADSKILKRSHSADSVLRTKRADSDGGQPKSDERTPLLPLSDPKPVDDTPEHIAAEVTENSSAIYVFAEGARHTLEKSAIEARAKARGLATDTSIAPSEVITDLLRDSLCEFNGPASFTDDMATAYISSFAPGAMIDGQPATSSLITARKYKLHLRFELFTPAFEIRQAFRNLSADSNTRLKLKTEFSYHRNTRVRKDADAWQHIVATGWVTDEICFVDGCPRIISRIWKTSELSAKYFQSVTLHYGQSNAQDGNGRTPEDYLYLQAAHEDAVATKKSQRVAAIIAPLSILIGYSYTFTSIATLPPSIFNTYMARDYSFRWWLGVIGTLAGLLGLIVGSLEWLKARSDDQAKEAQSKRDEIWATRF